MKKMEPSNVVLPVTPCPSPDEVRLTHFAVLFEAAVNPFLLKAHAVLEALSGIPAFMESPEFSNEALLVQIALEYVQQAEAAEDKVLSDFYQQAEKERAARNCHSEAAKKESATPSV